MRMLFEIDTKDYDINGKAFVRPSARSIIIKDKKIAINFVNELREKTKILQTFPECGAIPDDRIMKNSDYRFLVHKEYLIFYHYIAKDNTSYILSIFNAKRDYSRVMRKFIKK